MWARQRHSGEMLTKPFVFVVQVVATIFGTEAAQYESILTDPSHYWKDLHGIQIPWSLLSYRRSSLFLSADFDACANIGDVGTLGPSNSYKKPRCGDHLQRKQLSTNPF
ncbi:uncharacterized protein LOC142784455 [Rhipicephalus microplus]|uniref:uncharacterized protein LOC142784455 n=1 Tax=Rhipicephalus microplus TaxID=6941 RepID=UPI003F6D8C00